MTNDKINSKKNPIPSVSILSEHRTQNTEHRRQYCAEPDSTIIWHKGHVDRSQREQLLHQRGLVLWLTGLSGSGKSTIAVEVEKRLIETGRLCYRLDGDNLRHGLNSDLGFSPEERKENIRRVAEVAALFADAGLITLVSFIAPYRDMRRFARGRIGKERFIEIYVKASVETCKKRDPKGLYKMAESGEIDRFTGINAPYEVPEHPDVILNTESMNLEECVGTLFQVIQDKMAFD